MKKILLAFVIGLSLIYSTQAQERPIETSVDSLNPDSYRLSFSFSEKPLYSGNLDDEFPFELSHATRDASTYTIDSVKVSDDSLDVDVYLKVKENEIYHFLFNYVEYEDGTYNEEPIFIRLDNYTSQEPTRYTVKIEYDEAFTKLIPGSNILDVGEMAVFTTVYDASILNDTLFQTYLNQNTTNFGAIVIEDTSITNWLKNNSYLLDSKLIMFETYNRFQPITTTAKLNGKTADSVIFVGLSNIYDFSNQSIEYSATYIYTDIYNPMNIPVYKPDDADTVIELRGLISVSIEESPNIPKKTRLSAYPNPFNPSTQLQYTLSEAGSVTIFVFNVLGQQVRTLAEGTRSSGAHTTTFNATGLPGGMYVVRLESTGQSGTVFTETKKVMLLK